MEQGLAGVVLAAGAGSRLAPLTLERPKALCPVGNRPLVDHALDRLGAAGIGPEASAVNLHHLAPLLDAHLPVAVHRSPEAPEALGTAGALGRLRPWLAGRDVLLTNADAWLPDVAADLPRFVAGWDRERVRLLCVVDPARGDFGELRYCGVALLPGAGVARLRAEPSGLYEAWWREEVAAGRLDLVVHDGRFTDCATVRDYLDANLAASDGASVVAPGVEVPATAVLERSVVWAGAEVHATARLVDAIVTPARTVLVR